MRSFSYNELSFLYIVPIQQHHNFGAWEQYNDLNERFLHEQYMAKRMIDKEIEEIFRGVTTLQISTALLRQLFFGDISEEMADKVRAWYFDDSDGKRAIKDEALGVVFDEFMDKCTPSGAADIEKALQIMRNASEKELVAQ